MMSGVVQNQDSYMKGKIAQRWYYDRVAPALREAFDLFYEKTGRRYDFVLPYRCEDAEYIIVGMGCYMETCEATVDYLRRTRGIKVGCLNVCCFRPFPARQIVEALAALQGVHRAGTDGRSAFDDRQSSDARNQSRVLRCGDRPQRPGKDRSNSTDLFRLGGTWQSRCAAGRHHRRGRKHDRRWTGLFLRRNRSCTGVESDRRPRPARAGHVFDARPQHRRLRLGDHQQSHRHDRRRCVRQRRAGVSEIRLGKEGTADDLLSDDCRPAYLSAQRIGIRRFGRAQRHDGAVQRQSTRRVGQRAGRS